jgi:uncharacterized phage protein gp47/JayE
MIIPKDKFTIKQELIEELLDADFDTTPGSIADTFSGAFATKMADIYSALAMFQRSLDIDNMDDEGLKVFGRILDIYPYAPTPAEYTCKIVLVPGDQPENYSLNNGRVVDIEGYSFSISGIDPADYAKEFNIIAVSHGEDPNSITLNTRYALPVTPDTEFTVLKRSKVGTNTESFEKYRSRVADAFKVRPWGGNRAWFKDQADKFGGIGPMLISTSKTGSGANIKIYLATADDEPASPAICDRFKDRLMDTLPLTVESVTVEPTKSMGDKTWRYECYLSSNLPTAEEKIKKALKDFAHDINKKIVEIGLKRVDLVVAGSYVIHQVFPYVKSITINIGDNTFYDLEDNQICTVDRLEPHIHL